jgi:hypothetical protein
MCRLDVIDNLHYSPLSRNGALMNFHLSSTAGMILDDLRHFNHHPFCSTHIASLVNDSLATLCVIYTAHRIHCV